MNTQTNGCEGSLVFLFDAFHQGFIGSSELHAALLGMQLCLKDEQDLENVAFLMEMLQYI